MKQSEQRPLRVGLISLGCAKNLVDAEIMLGTLLKDGVEITNDAAEADVVIVNTCSFIDSAQEESVDTILESAELREAKHRGQGLIVSGCLPQRFREELPRLLPEVDAFMGIDQVGQVTDIVKQAVARRENRLLANAAKSRVGASGGKPGAPGPGRKLKVVGRLAELDNGHTHPEENGAEAIRGTERFGNTRTALEPTTARESRVNPPGSGISSAPGSDPLISVTPRPLYIPDYATPRFRLTPRHFA